MLMYAVDRLEGSLLNDDVKDSIVQFVEILDECEVSTREMWFERHYGEHTDFIFEVCELDKLQKLSEYMSSYTINKEDISWELLLDATTRIMRDKFLRKYVHVASLEMNEEQLLTKNYRPWIFFELDIEKIHRDKLSEREIYELFSKKILMPVYGCKTCYFEAPKINRMLQRKVLFWNVGPTISDNVRLRFFSAPISRETLGEVLEILGNEDRKNIVNGNKGIEYMVDFDYDGNECSNVGISIYQKKEADRLEHIKNLYQSGIVSKDEYSGISNWIHKEIIENEKGKSILFYQLAHEKIKIRKDKEAIPKIYLRIKEIPDGR